MSRVFSRLSFCRQNCMLLSIICLSALALPAFAAQTPAALPKTATLLPPETILVLDIENFAKTQAQFQKTNIYKLYKDPAMGAFINDIKSKVQQKIRQADSEMLTSIIDSNLLPSGRASLAVIFDNPTKDPNSVAILALTQWGANLSKITALIEKASGKAVADGARRKTEEYRGCTIQTIISKDSKSDANAISYGFIDDCLLASNKIDALKFVVAQIKGAGSSALAADSAYTATFAAVGPYHDLDFFLNVKQVIRVSLAHDTAGKGKSMVTNLGLDNVVSFALAAGIARTPNNPIINKMLISVNGPKKGICKMLEMESVSLKVPKFVPSDAYSFALMNLDAQKIYNEFYKIMYSFDPRSAAMLNMPILPPATPDGKPELDIKTGFIDYLGSGLVVVQVLDKSSSPSMPQPQSLYAIGINNRQGLEKSLSLVYEKMILPKNPQARRQLEGYTLYIINPTDFPMLSFMLQSNQTPQPGQPPQFPNIGLTVTDSHLIVGFEKPVEQAIRNLAAGQPQTLESVKWFAATRPAIPSAVGMAGLSDGVTAAQIIWQAFRQNPIAANPAAVPGVGSAPILEFCNPALLPDFNAVKKYFGPSAQYAISRPDGFFLEFKEVSPPAGN